MIEEILISYLNGSDLGAPVYSEIPPNPPSSFFTVEKTGSSMENHIYSSTVAIQSYGGSLYEAASANEKVKEIMLYDLIDLPDIARVSLNSDYNYTDTSQKRYRYQAVFDITHY